MKTNWCSCDGQGHLAGLKIDNAQSNSTLNPTQEAERAPVLSRRRMLWSAALAGVSWAARPRTALANVTMSPHRKEEERPVLVLIFLRGGADGLSIVVPYGEDAYARNRPNIGIAAPRNRRQGERAIDLNGFFGLHPRLAPLEPLYARGSLALVHACGSQDQTRSHFEAAAAMEQGADGRKSSASSGWLARYLLSSQDSQGSQRTSPLRAVAVGGVLPDSLRGAPGATVMRSLDEFRMQPASSTWDDTRLRQALGELYESQSDEIALAGRATLGAVDTLNRVDPNSYRPSGGSSYPDTELGHGLRQVACLLKARVGLEIACLDRGGWDTHVAQGSSGGWMGAQLDDVAGSLATFTRDLGPEMKRVTVVVMTEFGRRLQENSGLGTDHGRGSVMMLLGGSVRGGQVLARWPGLEEHQLEPPGDLRVTTDYRDVLCEVIAHHSSHADSSAIFPGYKPRFPGLLAA